MIKIFAGNALCVDEERSICFYLSQDRLYQRERHPRDRFKFGAHFVSYRQHTLLF